jgi:hypothetical protein
MSVFSPDQLANFKEMLVEWLAEQTRSNASIAGEVIMDLWIKASTRQGPIILPGFYELREQNSTQSFLSKLIAEVLSRGVFYDPNTFRMLVEFLLKHDRRSLLKIGKAQLSRKSLSIEIQVIWATALFAIDASERKFRKLASQSQLAVWEAIDLIGGSYPDFKDIVSLTPTRRGTLIGIVGGQFQNQGLASGVHGVWGMRNAWQAAEFVQYQIRQLAADESTEADVVLKKLQRKKTLQSYRDFIAHYVALRARHRRQISFSFADGNSITKALRNEAPANPLDLLSFVTDHLASLSNEIRNSPTERYRAYWNHEGRKLKSPKYEDICSGLLADDLQNRISRYGLLVTVEHHMVMDKECDVVVLQGFERLLPIEVKHHFHPQLWTAWRSQLDQLYARDPKAGGLGIYLVFWSGVAPNRAIPKPPNRIESPTDAVSLRDAIEMCIPGKDRGRLRVVVLDITAPK